MSVKNLPILNAQITRRVSLKNLLQLPLPLDTQSVLKKHRNIMEN